MKKYALMLLGFSLAVAIPASYAADDVAVDVVEEEVLVETVAPDPAIPAPIEAAPVAEAVAAPAVVENLEFVSGEITAVDEATKSVTVKLYGETEQSGEKTLTVTVDDATDITDGEKDRDLKSLTAGTEVDVEYDPASKKATYIFVY